MSLESADKLVQRILRQMGVSYQVEEAPDQQGSSIVTDSDSLSALPAELHPYVKSRRAKDPPGEESGASKF
jgi:hypothetical protein